MLIMRCGSWPELQDWRKALESAAKTKVKRQHFELVQEKVRKFKIEELLIMIVYLFEYSYCFRNQLLLLILGRAQ